MKLSTTKSAIARRLMRANETKVEKRLRLDKRNSSLKEYNERFLKQLKHN